MIPKSGHRFSEKIMLQNKLEHDPEKACPERDPRSAPFSVEKVTRLAIALIRASPLTFPKGPAIRRACPC
jgi:hypothetical protein